MKLYISDLDINKIDINLINKYLCNEIDYTLLYSYSGIYKIINNKLYKFIIKDKEIEKYNIDNINCLIDHSEIIYDEYYQIPIDHYEYKNKLLEYELGKKSPIKLIIELHNNSIIDFYFLFKNKNDNIEDHILSFLSYLTFI